MNYTGTVVKRYTLPYQQSPTTGRDELVQVKECADTAQTNCLSPTSIQYQNGTAGVSTTASTLTLGGVSQWYMAGYDINGDGYKDLIYQIGTSWYVAFGSANGYGAPVSTGITTAAYSASKGELLVGDLRGTGAAGLLANSGGTWYYWTWNGSSFTAASTGVAYDTTATAFALADTNGDGLPDLVSLNLGLPNTSAVVYIRLNTSSGGVLGFGAANTAYTNTDNPQDTTTDGGLRGVDIQHAVPIQRVDFNGDGRDDLVLHIQFFDAVDKIHYPEIFYLLGNGSTFTVTTAPSTSLAAYFLNWNDDRCTDYIAGNSLYLSACNGAAASAVTLPVTPIAAMDWDGDGREDFLYQSNGFLYVEPSTGQGLGSGIATGIAYNSSADYMGADISGDGLDDLVTWSSSGGTLSYNLHAASGQSPDLLRSIIDGYGNSVSPTYVSMIRGAYSNYTAASPTYPYALYMAPLYVVSNVVFSDPANPPSGTYSQAYAYIGSWTNVQGRGFSNFIAVQMHDSRNNIWRQDCYEVKFPFSGTHICGGLSLDQAGNQHIYSRFGNHAVTTLDSTVNNERYFTYQNQWTDQIYQLSWTAGSGNSAGPLTETDTSTYQYDNYGNATSIVTTKTDNDAASPYVGDSWTTTITNTADVSQSMWCLELLSTSQVSYTASNGSASVTRTRNYMPDFANCRYTQIVTEPASSTYQVTEALGYDSFGNINSDTTTGIGMAARQTTASWGATGQFPMAVTDPLNETTEFDYDFRYGLVSSETDPNLLKTSWAYGDGFGRLTQETRPDGTYTTYTYNDCVNWGGCLKGSHTLALAHSVYNTDGSIETDGTTYFDELERPLLSDNRMLAASTYDRNEVRYDSLGRVAQRAFPCVWSAVSTACPDWTSFGYDGLNRLVTAQRPISESDSTLQITTYGYEGRTTTSTDPLDHVRTLVYDVNGWLRETKDALGYAVTLGYDAAGAKTSVTDSLGHNLWSGSYVYGLAPFLTGETDIDRGTWGYTVDALGERRAWTDPKAQQFSESYDALSRPLTRTEPDLFTQWTWGSTAASYNIGKLQSVCSGTGTACSTSANTNSYTYDNKGRLSTLVTDYPLWGVFTTTWQYNATTGLLDTLTYPHSTGGNFEVKYAYQNGLLQSITDILDSPNITIWTANADNAAGQITRETLGNGLVTNRAFDAVTHWLQSVQSGPGGGASVQNQSFLYDEVGNTTQRQDNNLAMTENFYYDNDYRLSHSTLNGTQNLSLTYDPMGNITSRSDVAGGATWTYDPIHVHQVTQAGSAAYQYAYDANGNVKTRQGVTVGWSSYNYPTVFHADANGETVGLSYDDHRQAYRVQTNGPLGLETIYHVADGLFDLVATSAGTEYRHCIYAGSEPVAIVSRKSTGANAIYYLLSDHQGSVAAITDSAGSVVVGESFAAYGGRRNPATWSGTPSSTDLATIAGITRHGYTFQTALGSLMGLNYMIGRVQDAVTGRWLSADPYIPDVMDPQSYNRYSYVDNNPLTYIDPTGFDAALEPFPGPGVVVNGTTNPNAGPGGASVVGDEFGLPGGTFASTADLNDAAITSRLEAHADHQAAKGAKGDNPDSSNSQGGQSQQNNPPPSPPPPTSSPQQTSPPQPTSPPSGFSVITAGHAIEATTTIVIGIALAPAEIPIGVAAAAITGSYLTGELIGEAINRAMGQ